MSTLAELQKRILELCKDLDGLHGITVNPDTLLVWVEDSGAREEIARRVANDTAEENPEVLDLITFKIS